LTFLPLVHTEAFTGLICYLRRPVRMLCRGNR
jgi:hypothetical protein